MDLTDEVQPEALKLELAWERLLEAADAYGDEELSAFLSDIDLLWHFGLLSALTPRARHLAVQVEEALRQPTLDRADTDPVLSKG